MTLRLISVSVVLELTKDDIPECRKYLFTSLDSIKNCVLILSKSSYVYTINAQPLQNNVPTICLAVFGTDNKFTALNVISRWQYTVRVREKRYTTKSYIIWWCFRAMTDHVNLHKEVAARNESNNPDNAQGVSEKQLWFAQHTAHLYYGFKMLFI